MRTTNDAGIAVIKLGEACKLKAYLDGGGVPTIGWGHTKGVKLGQVITQAQADALLREDLKEAEAAVSKYVTVPLTDNQYGALVDFTFNLGAGALQKSTLVKLLNAGHYDQVPAQIMRFVYDNHKLVQGLVNRRNRCVALWNKK